MAYLNSWSFTRDIDTNIYIQADFYLMSQGAVNGRPVSSLGFVCYIISGKTSAIVGESSKTTTFTSSNAEDQYQLNNALARMGTTVDINTNNHYYTFYENGSRYIKKLIKTNLTTYEHGSNGGLAVNPDYAEIEYNQTLQIYHNDDGTKQLDFTYIIEGDTVVNGVTYNNLSVSGVIDLQDIGKIVTISRINPIALTDEHNPKIEFSNSTPGALTTLEFEMSYYDRDTETATAITKHTISTAAQSSYTMALTDAERDNLRALAFDKDVCEVRFTAYSTLLNDETVYAYHYFDEMSIVNCTPIINNLVIQEANDDMYALTGDRNVFIKYKSIAEFSFEPTAIKGATIVETTAQNGSKVFTNQHTGVFQNVESGNFSFYITDSRGKSISTSVVKQMVDYLNPTCYAEAALELVGETTVDAHLKVHGSYFNGNFGAADNELIIELRHTQNDGTMSNWVELTNSLVPVLKGNSYELEVSVRDLVYLPNYDFQFRVKDKANSNYINSSTLNKVLRPVYDWGEEDFNFNVPIYMNEKPVLRHIKDGNHTIISASGGCIHLRPNGTDDKSGEVVIYPDGTFTSGDDTGKADYIVETGTESMGTNGTWYWEKWNSGKAVCWGRKNYGKWNFNTAYGNFYTITSITNQQLPTGLFISAPQVVQANDTILNLTRVPTIASSYIGFYILSPTATTYDSTFVGFYIVGRWKEATT